MNSETDTHQPHNIPVVPGLEIVDLLAQGAHGSVYLARQNNHDRFVALKVLDSRFVDEVLRRRFDRERIALGRISDHPAVVPLIDSGYTESGSPYLILEYEPGGSLAEHLDSGGPMTVDEATKMVIELAAAVECSHIAGIIHRDIKPANIVKSAYNNWMLTDFGIASLIDRSNTGTVQVSYAHTAPETFDGGAASVANDVYSLASVLATALTDSEPFGVTADESPISTMRRVADDPYPDLRRFDVPDDLATLLEMGLSKDPMQRPASARSFAAALNEVRRRHNLMELPIQTGYEAGGEATATVSEADRTAATEPSWQSEPTESKNANRTGRLVAVSLAAVAVVGIGVAGFTDFVGDGPGDLATQIIGGDNDGPGNGPDTDNEPGDGDGGGPGNGRGNGAGRTGGAGRGGNR